MSRDMTEGEATPWIGAERVRATGFCVACDHRFTNEEVLRLPCDWLPGRYAYLEPRHLPGPFRAGGSAAGRATR
jgi:hypothetical protein